MSKNASFDPLADPRTTAGELINVLCCSWAGRRVNAIEVRKVDGEPNVYNVILLSPSDPSFRLFQWELPSRRAAENAAEALLAKILHGEITPETVIHYCDC